ncbi:Protein of uncharacterised function (DUF2884) [Klebsiella pneumoniae subsp. pneumoniae]|nr:Protein of uncharacterised function (DUF2884) [Klebsiella pneumoniae subsp. pneumoniae]
MIKPDGNLTFNGKAYALSAAQREQAQDYQASLRSSLPWIDEGARSRVEKSRKALDKIITEQVGANSSMHGRLTKLDAQLKEQMNRIIERRSDGLTFHYKAIDQVRADGQQLVNQAMGGILQDSINEMGAKAVLKGGGNPLQGILGSLGGLQTAIQEEWKNQEADFQQFGKDVCSRGGIAGGQPQSAGWLVKIIKISRPAYLWAAHFSTQARPCDTRERRARESMITAIASTAPVMI